MEPEDNNAWETELKEEWGDKNGQLIMAQAHDRTIKAIGDPTRLPFLGRFPSRLAQRYKEKYAIVKSWPVDLLEDILQAEIEIDSGTNGARVDDLLEANRTLSQAHNQPKRSRLSRWLKGR